MYLDVPADFIIYPVANSVDIGRRVFLGEMRPDREADHSHASSAEANKASLLCLHGEVLN
jgi:hypothetical protein